jgi:CubicO group peptidase (beta-lactamase class C family)
MATSVEQDPTVDLIDSYLSEQREVAGSPGLSAAVLMDGEVVHLAGYGTANVEWRTPATPDTVYELASITKSFTATAVMLLARDGLLALDDPIARFFPEATSAWSAITVRHLLAHTSGIPDYFKLDAFQLGEDDFAWRLDFSHDDVLDIARRAPLEFDPGTDIAYSNTGYTLLGLLIERLSGSTYAQFVSERIFQPLGMTETRRNSRTAIIPRRATGYVRDDGTLQNAPYTSMTWAYAEGGIVSTARDLSRWDMALTEGTLLDRPTLEAMWDVAGQDMPTFGLGFGVNTCPQGLVIGASGGKPGFSTYHSRYVDVGTTIILLANQSGVQIIEMSRGLVALLAGG